MASFGHVAVGLLTGRLHGGETRTDRPNPAPPGNLAPLFLFMGLSMLPDADVLLVALGVPDSGPLGHRGASHSFAFALAGGLVCALVARRIGWPVMRTALAGGLALASHAVLDALGAGGRGLMLLWPFSFTRFHSPWRIFPDAPRGLKLLSQAGLLELCAEVVIFSPLTLYALWPQIRARRQRRPSLQLIEGQGNVAAAPAPSAPEHDPRLRSSG
jgi:inner membrane protein